MQTRIKSAIKIRATIVLEEMGITVLGAFSHPTTRIANEQCVAISAASGEVQHDEWFRAKVREVLEDTGLPSLMTN